MLDAAMLQVKSFIAKYPIASVREHTPKHTMRATRTVLEGRRPLVRTTSATDVPDDYVPPLLTFSDLGLLHHKLVATERVAEIGYIKYVCKAYEGYLRVRRENGLKAKPRAPQNLGAISKTTD
jgi:hypothetical protein